MTWRILLLTLASSLSRQSRGAGADASGPKNSDPPALESGAAALGISFITGSTSTLRVERNGTRYVVDLVARTVREVNTEEGGADAKGATAAAPSQATGSQSEGAAIFARECAACHNPDGKGIKAFNTPDFTDPKTQARLSDEQILAMIKKGKKGTAMQSWAGKLSGQEILFVAAYIRSLGSRNEPSQTAATPAVTPAAETTGNRGFTTLATTHSSACRRDAPWTATVFTSISLIASPLIPPFPERRAAPLYLGWRASLVLVWLPLRSHQQALRQRLPLADFHRTAYPVDGFAYNFLSESNHAPLNATFRISVEGQNNFSRNFAENIELVLSRSMTHRAQIYAVPTISFNSHRLFSPSSYRSSAIPNLPGFNTFSTGFGGVVDIRPTVALVAEAIPTFVNGRPLGIHRPAMAFGIQKKIWRHAFTFGFTNSPGTTVSQRAGTRAAFLGDPSADTGKGFVIGFNITRQIY